MGNLAKTLITLGKNPLWVFAWGIFTMCVGYVADHEYNAPERAAYFRHKTTELGRLSDEFHRADQMVGLWRKAMEDVAQSAEHYDASLTAKALSPEHIALTTQKTIDEFVMMRHMLDTPIALISSMSFESASLKGLQAMLVQDLETADQIAEARVQFLTIMRDDLHKAAKLAPTITSNIKERRRVLEADARRAAVESILERARTEYNDTLAEARAQEAMYRMRSLAATAAWTFIGAFIGSLGGWKVRQIRTRRERLSPTEIPSLSNAHDEVA